MTPAHCPRTFFLVFFSISQAFQFCPKCSKIRCVQKPNAHTVPFLYENTCPKMQHACCTPVLRSANQHKTACQTCVRRAARRAYNTNRGTTKHLQRHQPASPASPASVSTSISGIPSIMCNRRSRLENCETHSNQETIGDRARPENVQKSLHVQIRRFSTCPPSNPHNKVAFRRSPSGRWAGRTRTTQAPQETLLVQLRAGK